ncbi:MAG: NADH-quinone oxidoreductase subunit L, partial [Cyclobacteriaceae bacterium]|nr:NADH-quinone oxidoreductase subunit L [Cyclobacteriaceae bacterium]
AGSVIHAVHSNLMTEMGGLRKSMPVTHLTFLIACLTIAGLPPLSGFFSKDEILVAAFNYNKVVFAVQWLVAGLTAFYMFRLYFRIFWSHEPAYHHPPHESPVVMTVPLTLLAIASIFAGFVPFHDLVTSDNKPMETHFHWAIAAPSILIALVGILVAAMMYRKQNPRPENVAKALSGFYTAVYNKFYIDEIYLFITKNIIFQYISRPVAWFDRHIVDGTMNFIGNSTVASASAIKKMQSGHVQLYIWFFASGALLLALLILYLN